MSQICTNKEQSSRLLEAGVRPETADMSYHFTRSRVPTLEWELQTKPPTLRGKFWTPQRIAKLAMPFNKHPDGTHMTGEEVFDNLWGKDVPAWSLSKMIEILPKSYQDDIDGMVYYLSGNFVELMYASDKIEDEEGDKTYTCANSFNKENLMDNVVDAIEWLIKRGHLNKKYLTEKGGSNEE